MGRPRKNRNRSGGSNSQNPLLDSAGPPPVHQEEEHPSTATKAAAATEPSTAPTQSAAPPVAIEAPALADHSKTQEDIMPSQGPAPEDAVAALNAYAYQNATLETTEAAPVLTSAEANEANESPVSPPRSSTKHIAFITPVDSVTSMEEAQVPRETGCVEARCGACTVM